MIILPFLIFFGLAVSSEVDGDTIMVPKHGGEGYHQVPSHR